jgi:hypothetical protein
MTAIGTPVRASDRVGLAPAGNGRMGGPANLAPARAKRRGGPYKNLRPAPL